MTISRQWGQNGILRYQQFRRRQAGNRDHMGEIRYVEVEKKRKMPSLSEFGSYKLQEGFDALGGYFNRGVDSAHRKAQLLSIDASLRKLALSIGNGVIAAVSQGDIHPEIPMECIANIRRLLETRKEIANR